MEGEGDQTMGQVVIQENEMERAEVIHERWRRGRKQS